MVGQEEDQDRVAQERNGREGGEVEVRYRRIVLRFVGRLLYYFHVIKKCAWKNRENVSKRESPPGNGGKERKGWQCCGIVVHANADGVALQVGFFIRRTCAAAKLNLASSMMKRASPPFFPSLARFFTTPVAVHTTTGKRGISEHCGRVEARGFMWVGCCTYSNGISFSTLH